MEYFAPAFPPPFTRNTSPPYSSLPQHDRVTSLDHFVEMPKSKQHTSSATPPTKGTNETKPRLGKPEVDVLEQEFQQNAKPSTQTKAQFAEQMGVDLPRINNWFQNRRAKRKQEKKKDAEAKAQSTPDAADTVEITSHTSEASSPDDFALTGYYPVDSVPMFENNIVTMPQPSPPYRLVSGPPPAVASYNPQYADPSSASIESLKRAMAAAAVSQGQDFEEAFGHDGLAAPEIYLHNSTGIDRAQFPLMDDGSMGYGDFNVESLFPTQQTPAPELQHPVPYLGFAETNLSMAAFPSELLQTNQGLALGREVPADYAVDARHGGSEMSIGFNYALAEPQDAQSPPGPSLPFKSPRPTNIASRRRRVQVKPAALMTAESLGRPSFGPRTASHTDGFRHPGSPMGSPMRRIASAGLVPGNRSVLSGRVLKSGVESAQRSPINMGRFSDADHAILDCVVRDHGLTAGSSVNSSLAPPTPTTMSPRERDMILKRDGGSSTASPADNGTGASDYGFQSTPGYHYHTGLDQNLRSPPWTPLVVQQSGGVPVESWSHYEVPDESLITPFQDMFPMEIHAPQPSYTLTHSQPVTPDYTQFPLLNLESPQFAYPRLEQAEYNFAESHPTYASSMMAAAMSDSKAKLYEFSNTTAKDFSEK